MYKTKEFREETSTASGDASTRQTQPVASSHQAQSPRCGEGNAKDDLQESRCKGRIRHDSGSLGVQESRQSGDYETVD